MDLNLGVIDLDSVDVDELRNAEARLERGLAIVRALAGALEPAPTPAALPPAPEPAEHAEPAPAPRMSARVRKLEQDREQKREARRAATPDGGGDRDLTPHQATIVRLLTAESMTARQLAQGLVVNVNDLGVELRYLVARGLLRKRDDGEFEAIVDE